MSSLGIGLTEPTSSIYPSSLRAPQVAYLGLPARSNNAVAQRVGLFAANARSDAIDSRQVHLLGDIRLGP